MQEVIDRPSLLAMADKQSHSELSLFQSQSWLLRAWRRREDGQRKRSPSHPRQVTRHFQQLSRLTAAFSDPISSDQVSNNTAHLLLVRDSSLQNLRHSVTPDARIYVPGHGDGSLGGEALPLPLFLSLLMLFLFCCSLSLLLLSLFCLSFLIDVLSFVAEAIFFTSAIYSSTHCAASHSPLDLVIVSSLYCLLLRIPLFLLSLSNSFSQMLSSMLSSICIGRCHWWKSSLLLASLQVEEGLIKYKTTTGKESEASRQALLNESDNLWTELRYNHIAKVIEIIKDRMTDIIQNSAVAKNKGKEQTITAMAAAVRELPEYQQTMNKLGQHVAIAQKVTNWSTSYSFVWPWNVCCSAVRLYFNNQSDNYLMWLVSEMRWDHSSILLSCSALSCSGLFCFMITTLYSVIPCSSTQF